MDMEKIKDFVGKTWVFMVLPEEKEKVVFGWMC